MNYLGENLKRKQARAGKKNMFNSSVYWKQIFNCLIKCRIKLIFCTSMSTYYKIKFKRLKNKLKYFLV